MNTTITKTELMARCLSMREQILTSFAKRLPIDRALSIQEIRELIDSIESEYKQKLESLWNSVRKDDNRSLDILLEKRYNRFVLGCEYSEQIHFAHADAEEITLWEQITNTNYRDVEQLNKLIKAYATDLLAHITYDFLEDIK